MLIIYTIIIYSMLLNNISQCDIIYTVVEIKGTTTAEESKGSEEMEPMTNEQSKRLEELIRENERLKAENQKLKKKLKKKK